MASIRLTQFAGLMPELSAKLKRKDNAQIAHNCLLYDGRLQSMPAFFKYDDAMNIPMSMVRASNGEGRVIPDFDLVNATYFENPPFVNGMVGIGVVNPVTIGRYIGLKLGTAGITGNLISAGIDPPTFSSAGIVQLPPAFLTPRPACVAYAVTYLRVSPNSVEESAPAFLGLVGNGGTLWHEGDPVQISMTLNPPMNGQTRMRLYRTITAIESGEQLVNSFDTDYYLVDEFATPTAGGVVSYTDNKITQTIRGDLLLTEQFLSPYYTSPLTKFGLTESGWLWLTSEYEVHFSERYMVHAWPQSNYLQIVTSDTINDATSFYDTLYLGTSGRPYKVTISTSNDDATQVNAYPYPEHHPCIPGTMVTAPFGGMYTSNQGIVGLEDEKMVVLTRDLLKGADILYRECIDGIDTTFSYSDINTGIWFNGFYIGQSTVGNGWMFVYQPPEDLNAVHPFQQLVTMDSPIIDTSAGPWALGDYGLQVAFGQGLYYWPIPGWVRLGDTPTKLCYRWKSKKFVMPGRTNFAAAKVVWECDGEVCFRLIVDCHTVFERKVLDCQPFRIPHNFIGIEFEIEMTGTGTVSEVHVASSVRELTEVETI